MLNLTILRQKYNFLAAQFDLQEQQLKLTMT